MGSHIPYKCKICEEYHCLAGCVPIEQCRIKALNKKHKKQGWLNWADYMELSKLEGGLLVKPAPMRLTSTLTTEY